MPMMKQILKGIGNAIALTVVFPCALTSWIEQWMLPRSECIFGFWSHVCAPLPGLPGMYVRRAFYRLTLASCSLDTFIGFGAVFSHRNAIVEKKVYIGNYALLGTVRLRANSLIGSRVSLISGGYQHEQDSEGQWQPADLDSFQAIEVGPATWIGEAATVMADVGQGTHVCAGAVVSARVPKNTVVAGNPARFVRRLETQGKDDSRSESFQNAKNG